MGLSAFACTDVRLWRGKKWTATESTKGNARHTTVLDASYLPSERVTAATLPLKALLEYARSSRAGGSYCGLEFTLTADQRKRLREFGDSRFAS